MTITKYIEYILARSYLKSNWLFYMNINQPVGFNVANEQMLNIACFDDALV